MDTSPQRRVVAVVSAAAADLVFADGPQTAEELFDAARDGTLEGFALPGTITLVSRSRIEPLESRNVVAKLAGSDAALGPEHVVYSAHLDHVGIGAPVDCDKIYQGSIDNALGVAHSLKAARQLAHPQQATNSSPPFLAGTNRKT